MLQKMKIRKGTIADMPSVLKLIKELADFEREPDAVEISIHDLERDGFGEAPLFQTFVAEVGESVVGIALYYYRFSTWKGKTIHLEDLVVTDNMRGKGVGFALYSAIINQGFRDRVRRIEWNVLDWNKPAIDFYEKTGAKIQHGWLVAQMDQNAITDFVTKNESKDADSH